MKILALDPATATGWAFGDANDVERKTLLFGRFRMPMRTNLGERFLYFKQELTELITLHQPDLIASEEPFWPAERFGPRPAGLTPSATPERGVSQETLRFLQKLNGVLHLTAAEMNVPIEEYMSATWRVTALGYGRGKGIDLKKAMRLRARGMGYEVTSDDEADAIGIAIHALCGAPASKRAQLDLMDLSLTALRA